VSHVLKENKLKALSKVKMIFILKDSLSCYTLGLFGTTRTKSIGGRRYGLVIVDDYTR